MRASWTICEQVVPRRKRAVLGFSVGFGAFLSRARLLRALRGFLGFLALTINERRRDGCLHLAQHLDVAVWN